MTRRDHVTDGSQPRGRGAPRVGGGDRVMRIIGLTFAEQPGTPLRWLCGVVADFGDGVWAYAELKRELWIPCPPDTVPESAWAILHERLTQSRN